MAGNRVVFGVTASIAIYKSLEVISILKKRGFEIRVAMTNEAKRLISPVVFRAITNNEVYDDVMEEMNIEGTNITHIAFANWGDVFAIVPATANIISKVSCGIADDPVSLTALASTSPKVIAPAMNTDMYLNPIIQRHVKALKNLGWLIVEPVEGDLACERRGIGHIANEESIADAIESCLYSKTLLGKKVIVTAGPTSESIDPVRYITNRSSGKMGFALAKMAMYLGAEVTLITGKTCLNTPFNVKRIDCESTEDMLHALTLEIDKNDELIVIMAAAIADFKPGRIESKKIKKNADKKEIQKYIEYIKNESKNMSELLNNLLEMNDTNLELNFISLENVIRSVLMDFEEQIKQYSIKLKMEIEEHLSPIRSDKNKLKISLRNIIDNCVKVMKHGGELTISVKKSQTIENSMEIIIKDTGPGIPKNILKNIFKPFESGGSVKKGIGLPLAKHSIEILGGELYIESEIGIGTTFKIILPV